MNERRKKKGKSKISKISEGRAEEEGGEGREMERRGNKRIDKGETAEMMIPNGRERKKILLNLSLM